MLPKSQKSTRCRCDSGLCVRESWAGCTGPFVPRGKPTSGEVDNAFCVDLNKTSSPGIFIEKQILRMLWHLVAISLSVFEQKRRN